MSVAMCHEAERWLSGNLDRRVTIRLVEGGVFTAVRFIMVGGEYLQVNNPDHPWPTRLASVGFIVSITYNDGEERIESVQ